MPPSRRTQQRFQSLDGICRIVLFAPPGTFYIPDAAVSMVMRHGYHPYAIEYAETHPLMVYLVHFIEVPRLIVEFFFSVLFAPGKTSTGTTLWCSSSNR